MGTGICWHTNLLMQDENIYLDPSVLCWRDNRSCSTGGPYESNTVHYWLFQLESPLLHLRTHLPATLGFCPLLGWCTPVQRAKKMFSFLLKSTDSEERYVYHKGSGAVLTWSLRYVNSAWEVVPFSVCCVSFPCVNRESVLILLCRTWTNKVKCIQWGFYLVYVVYTGCS